MNLRKPVLLCVDDEEANLKLLEKLLVPRGYTVVCADSGKDAMLKIKSQAIDLVLLDILMPGMDGFEVCRQIKEDQKLKSIPVIMVTALTDKKDRIRGIEAGAEEFLSKPFDLAEVLARITILLKMKALDDERKHAEELLQNAHDELECKVQERTVELADANEKLKADIIKREQVEESLRKSEENFHRSLDESPLGVRIATAKGKTIYANKAILEIYGYANVDELDKIPLKERYTPQSYAESLSRKKTWDRGDFGPSEYEINIVRKNKEIRHLLVLRKEILWNGIKKFQVIYQDITERKRAEAALTKSEEKFRKAFNTSPDSVAITRLKDGMYISINPGFTKLTGYTEDDIFGKTTIGDNIWDNIEDRQRLVAGLKKDGEVTNLEAAFRMKDGNIRYGLMSASIIDLAGAPCLLSITRDITERKQVEEKIKNSLAEKEVLLKEVHHRVKNNLMIIIGLIKMQETKVDNEMFNPLLQELEGRIRAMTLVHEGLHNSADLAHVNLQNYIETMSPQIRGQFGADRDIRFSVHAVGVEVSLDKAVSCGLILNELITNAFMHAFPAGRPGTGAGKCEINVRVNQEGDMNVLTVADNGIGLPADLNWEKSDSLGLQLVRMLSRQINGSIELDSSAGTVFRLKFPWASA